MAAFRRDTPPRSFFSSPSHAFRKLVHSTVGVFPKSQKQQHHLHHLNPHPHPHQQEKQQRHPQEAVAEEVPVDEAELIHGLDSDLEDGNSNVEGEERDTEQGNSNVEDEERDAKPGEVDREVPDIDYDGLSGISDDGGYSRPRIREDLLPHDFSEWQKSPCNSSVVRYALSEASSSSNEEEEEVESFSEVLSSSTSQERQTCCDGHSKKTDCRRPPSYRDSVPALANLRLSRTSQNVPEPMLRRMSDGFENPRGGMGAAAGLKGLPLDVSCRNGGLDDGGRWLSSDDACDNRKERNSSRAVQNIREMMQYLVRSGDCGEVDMGFYPNLVQMFPLLETSVEDADHLPQRRNFQHHASMVYTRAPLRDAQVRKAADAANARRNSRNHRRGRKGEAVREERENLLRRMEADDCSSSPQRVSYESTMEIAKLQAQVEQLQRKLAVREGMLEAYRFGEAANTTEVMSLVRRVEELQRLAVEKEIMRQSVEEKITQKQGEMQNMQRLLHNTERSYADLKAKSAINEEEVRALRCEVAALRWQMEVTDVQAMGNQSALSDHDLVQLSSMEDFVIPEQQKVDMDEMEAARKMYMAALIAAKRVCQEECLVLVEELRVQLQSFLRRPTFHGCPFRSQSNGYRNK